MDTGRVKRAIADGLVAAGSQIAAGEAAAALLPGARSPLTGMGRALIDATPAPLVDVGVALLEERDKPMLMGNLVMNFAAVGVSAAYLHDDHPGAALGAVAGHSLLAGAAAASRPDARGFTSLLSGLAGAIAGAAALTSVRCARGPRSHLAVGAAAAGLAAVARTRRGRETAARLSRREAIALPHAGSKAAEGWTIDGLSPLYTPNLSFYETDITFPPPVLDVRDWRLRVVGSVDRPFELSYDDLLAVGVEEHDATLVCVHNPVGGPRIGTARWTGVPVARLLERAGVRPGADQLLARSVDGFTAGVPLSMIANDHRALVAIGMNGEPLPVGHGFPARLLVPGLYGYDANTKWLTELELTRFDEVADYWTRRGWPREPATVLPSARIDVPHPRSTVPAGAVTVAGVAWSPPHGVDRVEVAVDGGEWQEANLGADLGDDAWRQWRTELHLEPGRHELRVRTAGQAPAAGPPYPNGAGGFHKIAVQAAADADVASASGGLREAAAIAGERALLARQGARAWLSHGRGR